MQFTSLSFFLFAAVTVLLYFTACKRVQWCLLLAASYLFYLFAGAEYLLFILYTTLVTYVTARLMQKRADAEDAFVAQNRDTMEKAARKAYRARPIAQRKRKNGSAFWWRVCFWALVCLPC